MINEIMEKVIFERKNKHIEDYYGIQNCWDKIIEIISVDVNETIDYLDNTSKENIYFISEVFEDNISVQLQSKEYIACLRRIDDKYPDLNMTEDIDLAEEYIGD